jgi:hypothetical protein
MVAADTMAEGVITVTVNFMVKMDGMVGADSAEKVAGTEVVATGTKPSKVAVGSTAVMVAVDSMAEAAVGSTAEMAAEDSTAVMVAVDCTAEMAAEDHMAEAAEPPAVVVVGPTAAAIDRH